MTKSASMCWENPVLDQKISLRDCKYQSCTATICCHICCIHCHLQTPLWPKLQSRLVVILDVVRLTPDDVAVEIPDLTQISQTTPKLISLILSLPTCFKPLALCRLQQPPHAAKCIYAYTAAWCAESLLTEHIDSRIDRPCRG